MKKEFKIGAAALALKIILTRFTSTPYFILGMLLGISICFNILGLLPATVHHKLKAWKKAKGLRA